MNISPMLFGMPKDCDLLAELTRVCVDAGVDRASVQVIGALSRAVIGFYHQDEQRYETHALEEPLEILAGLGSVSLKDDAPFVHLHLTLGSEDTTCIGGHAMQGCVVFAAEALITPIAGAPLVRELDQATGLPLWRKAE